MGAVDSSFSDSLAYSVARKEVTSVRQTGNGTPLISANNVVRNVGGKKNAWFYNDPNQVDTTMKTNVVVGKIQTGTPGDDNLPASYSLVSSGSGSYTISVASGSGVSEIFDFDGAADKILLSGFGQGSAAEAISGLRQVGPNVVLVRNDGKALWFRKTMASSLSAPNFVFP